MRNAWIPQPRKSVPLLLIPEYSGINKGQRVPDRSKTAHRKPLVKRFLTPMDIGVWWATVQGVTTSGACIHPKIRMYRNKIWTCFELKKYLNSLTPESFLLREEGWWQGDEILQKQSSFYALLDTGVILPGNIGKCPKIAKEEKRWQLPPRPLLCKDLCQGLRIQWREKQTLSLTPDSNYMYVILFHSDPYFHGGSDGKASAYKAGDRVQSLGGKDSLEKEMATHSSTLAWKIPWMEEPGRLMELQRVGHDWVTSLHFIDLCWLFCLFVCLFMSQYR